MPIHPNIEELVNITKYWVFNTLDLKTAYHLVPLLEDCAYSILHLKLIAPCASSSIWVLLSPMVSLCFQRNLDYFMKWNHLQGMM